MKQLLSSSDFFLVLQPGILGLFIGIIFSYFGFKPPSPDNISGIIGIIGIFFGWLLGTYLFK